MKSFKRLKASHCIAIMIGSIILGVVFIYVFWPVALGFGVLAIIAAIMADYKLPKII